MMLPCLPYSCVGEPGVRRRYGENYYACFVVDLEGHRFEAVFQDEEEGEEG